MAKRRTKRRRKSNGQFAGFKDEAKMGGSVFGLAALGVLALLLTSRPRA